MSQRRIHRLHRLSLIICVICGCVFALLRPLEAKASTIFGRVIEVNSGDTITIFNLNRPVRVRLLGVDAPELNQQFGDVATKHLSDLVFDKSVLVEYSGIAADRSLTGRVLLNNADIGAQMVRDGAAWVDANNQDRLNTTDREVYRQSELAARSERRGLWQFENPTAPWEFVKAEALKKNPYASLKSVLPDQKPRTTTNSELTNLTLMTRGLDSRAESWSPTEHKNWRMLRPEGEQFSALVPEDGKIGEFRLEFGELNMNFKSFHARDGWALYWILWIDGSAVGETHDMAMSSILEGFLASLRQGSINAGTTPPPQCQAAAERNISRNGYTGTEFDMSSCPLPLKARAFTKLKGNRRYMYFGAVAYSREEPNINKFLESFTVDGPAKRVRR